jgi:tetratricopeptide repeat protein 21B
MASLYVFPSIVLMCVPYIFGIYLKVTLAEVELGLRRQQYDRCVITLGTIPASSTYYIRARVKLADIYIKHKRNKNAFSQCYQELATELKSVHGYTLLGQAYMRVQEPERAILSFERALLLEPENPTLASRIGRTLVMTHDYARAAQYYEAAAAKSGVGRVTLLHELADLYNTQPSRRCFASPEPGFIGRQRQQR